MVMATQFYDSPESSTLLQKIQLKIEICEQKKYNRQKWIIESAKAALKKPVQKKNTNKVGRSNAWNSRAENESHSGPGAVMMCYMSRCCLDTLVFTIQMQCGYMYLNTLQDTLHPVYTHVHAAYHWNIWSKCDEAWAQPWSVNIDIWEMLEAYRGIKKEGWHVGSKLVNGEDRYLSVISAGVHVCIITCLSSCLRKPSRLLSFSTAVITVGFRLRPGWCSINSESL